MKEGQYSAWMLEHFSIGDTVRLRVGDTSMGRHSSSTIRILEAAFVSRHHAIIKISENEEVSVVDVSSNGIFVNGQRYDKGTVKLQNNDFIGFGISPTDFEEDADLLTLPIYRLKYSPIKILEIPKEKKIASVAKIETDNNVNEGMQEPDSGKNGNKAKLLYSDQIYEISDDEDEDKVLKESKSNETSIVIEQNHADNNNVTFPDNQENLVSNSNKQNEILIKNGKNVQKNSSDTKNSDNEILSEDKDDDFVINPSQKYSYHQPDVKVENEETLNKEAATTFMDPLSNKEAKEVIMHIPIIPNIKKERLRSVSAAIQSIFGDIEGDDEIQKTIKEIDPFVYREINASKNSKPLNIEENGLNDGDLIDLSDYEDMDEDDVEDLGAIVPVNTKTEKELPVKEIPISTSVTTVTTGEDSSNVMQNPKSPCIFDSSLDNSNKELNTIDESQTKEDKKKEDSTNDSINLSEYTTYLPPNADEDIEDIMFSQALIDEMKAELPDIDGQENIPLSTTNVDAEEQSVDLNIQNEVRSIKQEASSNVFYPFPNIPEDSCWIISDDDDYDEGLEAKVNDWSNKIFSQSFNILSQSMSQVYEMDEADKNDSNEGEDCLEEDNTCLLEDDIEGRANIYNNTLEDEEFDADFQCKSLREALEKAETQKLPEIDNTPPNEVIPNADITKEDEKIEPVNDVEIKPDQTDTAITSPPTQNSHCNNLITSPIIRLRRTSNTRQLSSSSSSSEGELDQKVSNNLVDHMASKQITSKKGPQVIESPYLPKHKGKLRGVSAELSNKEVTSKLKSVKEKYREERYIKDMKKKYLEKPSVARKHEKEQKKLIKERRKTKLKELAGCKKELPKERTKRKRSTDDREQEHKPKVAKVKVTVHNRGAFLADNKQIPPPPCPTAYGQSAEQSNQFKIPKITKNAEEQRKQITPSSRSLSVDCFETFSQQISKPDELLMRNKCDKQKPKPPRRKSATEALKRPASSAVCKDAIAARAIRTTNKITFASMEKNIVESEENKRKLCELNATSLLPPNEDNSSAIPTAKKLKKVRFNDTPVIHYIERITGADKKIINKDVMPMTTFKDRRHLIRTAYPIIDHTDTIITNILSWSNEWLIKRNAAAEAASDVIYPMATHFNSFEQYKSIIFPLMKIEFASTLERDYHFTRHLKKFKICVEYATHYKDRIRLVTKCLNAQNKQKTDRTVYDLVLLESTNGNSQMFAFVISNRRGPGSCSTIVYEVIAKNFSLEYFNTTREFNVRPVMDKVRIHFGAFNAVYQLEATPLFQKILNPAELLKCKSPAKRTVIYRGFTKLDDTQKQVLLNTYVRVIDESAPNISLIQGPPGTGKSCVITNLILQTLYGEEIRYLDKKILVCAQSNAAVDVIAGKLYSIAVKMRPEKRFRLIRYGILNKIHPSVQPIALQKIIEHDQLKKLNSQSNIRLENKENLINQITQFEAHVAEMSSRNTRGTIEEDLLIEKKRQLQLMRNILNENMRPEDERSLFSWYLSNANVVCTTLASCVNLSQYMDFFDICIIDEATQCTEPWTLLPLKFGINSLVLVGDIQQLPATVLSKKASELGLGNSLFTRIQNCLDRLPSSSAKGCKSNGATSNSIIYSLQTQYRMHPEICLWPNQYFYRNELINAKSTKELNKSPLMPFSILSLSYEQNNSAKGKITNALEAEFVARLLKALDGYIPNKYNSYGVITPYSHHRDTLELSIRNVGLTNIMVNTIDSYQGHETNVIVISNARTNGIGFLSNPQRLNVALTRSKKCLILCGNFKSLESVPVWHSLLENARERKLYHEITSNCMEDIQRNVIDKIKLKNQ